MRISLLGASAAIVMSLALSACSGGTSSTPAAPASATVETVSHGQHFVTHLMRGVKPMTIGCDYSVYAFCFYVEKGNAGPYVETSAGSAYELYNNAWITKNKTGKTDKKFSTYFYPDPGNPTYQYINYTGKTPKKTQPVKFTDYYCIGFSPSACTGSTYTFKLGIALTPAT